MLTAFALTAALAAAPAASTGAPDRPITRYLQENRFVAAPVVDARLAQSGSRDPLTNGARIGAIVLGAATGIGVAWLCNAISEEGDPPCWKPVLFWTAAGAGAGALIGAGVDALFHRRLVVRTTVKF
jgi:hypothetical protein